MRRVFSDSMPPWDSQFYFGLTRTITDCARLGYLSVPQEPVKFTFDERKESKTRVAAVDAPHSTHDYYQWMNRKRLKTDNISNRIKWLTWTDARNGLRRRDRECALLRHVNCLR